MAHNIHFNEQTNQHSFFSVQEKPWHGLGKIVTDYPNSREALEYAGLNFEVEKRELFTENKIDDYANLQKSIVTNVSKILKPGGLLLYITCSVFQKENENVVNFVTTNLSLQLQSSAYFKGYNSRADTMFAAVFINGK